MRTPTLIGRSAQGAQSGLAPMAARPTFFAGELAQRQQFLDSYVRVRGHEPSAHEIEEFERRHGIAAPASITTDRKGVE